jgi:hypothetical protein
MSDAKRMQFDEKAASNEAWTRVGQIQSNELHEGLEKVSKTIWFEAGARWQFAQLQSQIEENERIKNNYKDIAEMLKKEHQVKDREIAELKLFYKSWRQEAESNEEALKAERAKNQAVMQALENKQKIIAVMAYDLLNAGINFDFQTALDRHETLAKVGKN